MEDENDEDSAYHPHDLSKYCQFCLDRMQPVAVERPFTVNPIIPLVDPSYDHVIKKYPKRSYCILRNCIRVSDLLKSSSSTVFELLRPKLDIVQDESVGSMGKSVKEEPGICSRLRSSAIRRVPRPFLIPCQHRIRSIPRLVKKTGAAPHRFRE